MCELTAVRTAGMTMRWVAFRGGAVDTVDGRHDVERRPAGANASVPRRVSAFPDAATRTNVDVER